MPDKPVVRWVVWHPEMSRVFGSSRKEEALAIAEFGRPAIDVWRPWRELYRAGWRCTRVTLKEPT